MLFFKRYYLRSIGLYFIGFSIFGIMSLEAEPSFQALMGFLILPWFSSLIVMVLAAIEGSYAGIFALFVTFIFSIATYLKLFFLIKNKDVDPKNMQFFITSASVFSLFLSCYILIEIFVPLQLNLSAKHQFNNQFCQFSKLSAYEMYKNSISDFKPDYNATLLAKDGRYNWSFRQAAWVHASYEWYAQGSNYTPNQILEQDLKSFKTCMAKK